MTTLARREFVALAAAALGAASAEVRGTEIPLGRGLRFEPGGQYFMPTHFGPRLAGKASSRYLDVTSFAVSYATDPDRLARCLPPPFEVTDDPRITVFYALNRGVEWLAGGSYNLLGVNARARFNGQADKLEGEYCLVLWEDDCDAITNGRELLGIPKIFANIEDVKVLRGQWRTSASHRGHEIMSMAIHDLAPVPADELRRVPAESAQGNWFGWKYIPGGVSYPTVVPTTARPAEAWKAQGEVHWRELTWEQNPTQAHIVEALRQLPIRKYVSAVASRGMIDLSAPGRSMRALR